MPINTTTFVLSAIAEKAAGVPQGKALPIALFASTLRPMMGLVFALLLGKSALASSPSSSTTPAPAPSGTGGSGGGGSGGTNIPQKIPSFLHMSRSEAKAWAHIIGLTARFDSDAAGLVVIGQIPDKDDDMPADHIVKLKMGEHRQQAS
jgi:hypothetical protein